jgi:methylmalonyl-CoA mutase N-terminal domain/subunit
MYYALASMASQPMTPHDWLNIARCAHARAMDAIDTSTRALTIEPHDQALELAARELETVRILVERIPSAKFKAPRTNG